MYVIALIVQKQQKMSGRQISRILGLTAAILTLLIAASMQAAASGNLENVYRPRTLESSAKFAEPAPDTTSAAASEEPFEASGLQQLLKGSWPSLGKL